jgi:nitroimidazol reductase NimA-like FMN-containing flavoprotein (pyridoxamine 5'-phosphate oxidase superfamily)
VDEYQTTERNRVRQIREFADYETRSLYEILDAGYVGHVGFVQGEQPFVIPMLYARDDDVLYLHGAKKSRIVKHLASGAPVCVNVTLLDGIVAARSAFNSSMNYRSAVVFGTGRLLESETEVLRALEVVSEHVFPGRWQELRAPLDRELAMTGVISVAIESASAKIAADPPEDEEADYATRVWAGVVPIVTSLGEPRADDRVLDGVSMSPAIRALEGKRL